MSGCGRVRGTNKEATQLRILLRAVGVYTPRDPKKIYERAIAKLHSEERAFARKSKRRIFTRLVEKCSTFRYPGLFNDYNSKTKDDDKTLLGVQANNRRIFKSVRRRFARKGWRVRRREYLKELVQDMMVKTARQRVNFEPLEKTVLETVRGAKSDCTELTRYAFARLKLAGFKPQLVFVKNKNEDVQQIGTTITLFHVLIAVKDPTNARNTFFIDLYTNYADGFVSEPQQKSFIETSTMMSIYHQNTGTYFHELRDKLVKFIESGNTSSGSSLFDRAVLGLAMFFKDASEGLAFKHYNRAIHYNSTYAPALYSKAHLLWVTGGNLVEARALVVRALQLMPSNQEAERLFAAISTD